MQTTRSNKSPRVPTTKTSVGSTQKSLELLEKNRKIFEKIFDQKIDAYDKTQGNLIIYPLEINLGTIHVGEIVNTLFAIHVENSEGDDKKDNIRIKLPEDCYMKTSIRSYGYIYYVMLELIPSEVGPLNLTLQIYTEKYSYNLPVSAKVLESSDQKTPLGNPESFILTSPATTSPVSRKKLSEFATPILLEAQRDASVKKKKNEFSEKAPFEYGKRHRTVMFMWD